MTTTTGYKVVVMSDLHLGMKDSSPKKILEFLESIETDLLILNGDIIDIDALKRGSKWKNKHTKVVMKLLDMSRHTDIIYIRGNHDSDVEEIYDYSVGNIKFMDEYLYKHNGKKILIFHGDKIDVTIKYKLLSHIGSIGYDIALRLNTWYNEYRMRSGKPYYSISKWIKENVKKAISFINDFESNACNYAKSRMCDAVICGHIHIPTIKKIDGIRYYNSGDWVENFTCIVLTREDEWKLIQT
jgi:UDP-2,3-diacylglucosamine pyrophosphatase LpxH